MTLTLPDSVKIPDNVNESKFLSFHALQSFPDVLLNRGERGEAKTLTYGSALRVRVSSQANKKPIRSLVREELKREHQSYSSVTRRLPSQVADLLRDKGFDSDQAHLYATVAVSALAKVATDGKGQTRASLVASISTAGRIADIIEQHRDDFDSEADKLAAKYREYIEKKGKALESGKKEPEAETYSAAATLNKEVRKKIVAALSPEALDLSLFGRFIAELTELDATVDSAVSVPNSFTVHRAQIGDDYFTLTDDLIEDGLETKTINLGHQQYSSGTFYRYASLDVEQLRHNIGKWAPEDKVEGYITRAIELFAAAFFRAVPSAKKNQSHNYTAPEFLLITGHDSVPYTGSAAFKTPVEQSNDVDDYSARRLVKYLHSTGKLNSPATWGTGYSLGYSISWPEGDHIVISEV